MDRASSDLLLANVQLVRLRVKLILGSCSSMRKPRRLVAEFFPLGNFVAKCAGASNPRDAAAHFALPNTVVHRHGVFLRASINTDPSLSTLIS